MKFFDNPDLIVFTIMTLVFVVYSIVNFVKTHNKKKIKT